MGDDLPEAVVAFWRFLWPSTLHLGVMVGLLLYLAPRSLDLCRELVRRSATASLLAALRSETAEAIGLNKLAPFLTLFVILLTMVMANDIAQWSGGVLPPEILWSSPADILAIGRDEQLLAIWDRYPSVETASQLGALIDDLYTEHAEGSGYSFWQDRVDFSAQVFHRLKFYALWALICSFIGFRQGGRRPLMKRLCLVVLPALIGASVLSVGYAVHSYNRFTEGKIWVAHQQTVRTPPVEVSLQEVERRRSELAHPSGRGEEWWQLGLPSWTW